VSTIDITPSILAWIGEEPGDLPGIPLIENHATRTFDSDRVVFSGAQGEEQDAGIRRFAARDEHWKVHAEYDVENLTLDGCRLFDLSEDPDERKPADCQKGSSTSIVERVEEHGMTRIRNFSHKTVPEANDEPEQELEARLEALGYR